LYGRIPRSLRGQELTRAELEAQSADLKADLALAGASSDALARVERFERSVVPDERHLTFVNLVLGDLTLGRQLRALDDELSECGVAKEARAGIVQLAGARSVLLRRMAYLRMTKRIFELWHVFHLPLVYLLLLIAATHVGVALYLGYVPFRW
jgi:hypothetical protein